MLQYVNGHLKHVHMNLSAVQKLHYEVLYIKKALHGVGKCQAPLVHTSVACRLIFMNKQIIMRFT